MIPSVPAPLDSGQEEALSALLQEDLEGLKSLAALGHEQARELLWRNGHSFGSVVTNAMLEHHANTARGLFATGIGLEAIDLTYTKVTGTGLRHLRGLRARSLTLPKSVCTSVKSYPFFRKPRVTKRALKHLAGLEGLEHLDLRSVWLEDVDATDLARLDSLRELELGAAPVSDAALEPLSALRHLEHLGVSSETLTGAGLTHLEQLPALRSLRLWELKAGDAALTAVAGLSALEALDLRRAPISDAGLAHLRGAHLLRHLSLSDVGAGPTITDSGLAQLQDVPLHSLEVGAGCSLAACARFSSLRRLSADHEALTQETLESVLQLPHLESLALHASAESACLGSLGTLEQLQELRLQGFGELAAEDAAQLAQSPIRKLDLNLSGISEASCKALASCATLRELRILSPQLSDAGLGHLSSQGALHKLELHGPLRDPGLAHLLQLPALRVLRLCGSGTRAPSFTSAGLSPLRELHQLRELTLSNAGITNDASSVLSQLRGLRRLELFSNPLGASTAERLQAQLPECLVGHTGIGR